MNPQITAQEAIKAIGSFYMATHGMKFYSNGINAIGGVDTWKNAESQRFSTNGNVTTPQVGSDEKDTDTYVGPQLFQDLGIDTALDAEGD